MFMAIAFGKMHPSSQSCGAFARRRGGVVKKATGYRAAARKIRAEVLPLQMFSELPLE